MPLLLSLIEAGLQAWELSSAPSPQKPRQPISLVSWPSGPALPRAGGQAATILPEGAQVKRGVRVGKPSFKQGRLWTQRLPGQPGTIRNLHLFHIIDSTRLLGVPFSSLVLSEKFPHSLLLRKNVS